MRNHFSRRDDKNNKVIILWWLWFVGCCVVIEERGFSLKKNSKNSTHDEKMPFNPPNRVVWMVDGAIATFGGAGVAVIARHLQK